MQKGVLSSMPAILVHGHEDRVVRRVNQDQLALQFRVLNGLGPGTAAPEVDKPARTGANPSHAYRLKDFRHGRKLLLRVCEVQQLEHAWSGGDCSLNWAVGRLLVETLTELAPRALDAAAVVDAVLRVVEHPENRPVRRAGVGLLRKRCFARILFFHTVSPFSYLVQDSLSTPGFR